MIFGRFKEKSRRHPFIRLSRGFDAEDANSSISGFKFYYWAVPKFRGAGASKSITALPKVRQCLVCLRPKVARLKSKTDYLQ